jgi:acyl-CoA thioester hydrolase
VTGPEPPPERFGTRVRVDIRWRDLDTLGHLNQAVYHEYLEEGRSAFFGRLAERDAAFPFVLARVELDYRREVRHSDGHVEVVTEVERVGRSSITVANRIELPGGEVAAEGRSVLVAWDPEARGKRELTAAERAALGI